MLLNLSLWKIRSDTVVSSILIFSSIFAIYYLIQTTFINMNATSGLGATFHYDSLKNLIETKNKYRVISAGYMTSIPIFYDLDTFDGFNHNSPIRRNYFLAYAVNKPAVDKFHMHVHFFHDFSNNIDLNMLKLANVRYVISDKKLNHKDLNLTSYSQPIKANDINYFFKKILKPFFKDLQIINPLFLYEMDNSWPRFFVAKRIRKSKHSFRDKNFYQDLIGLSMNEILLAKEENNIDIRFSQKIKKMNILSYTLNVHGAIINLSDGGGVLVFNQVHTPLWEAYCENNQKLSIFPVNGIMMAVDVPEYCKKVVLSFSSK